VQRAEEPNLIREAVALIDAADQPLTAEHVVIDTVFVGAGAETGGAELEGHHSQLLDGVNRVLTIAYAMWRRTSGTNMIWLYAVISPSGNRLALLISALRVIGILGFALLAGFFIIQDAYLETTLSILTALAWIAATTEAMDLVLERYS
jgi:hypothetical protein